jgi:dUTP pyrophosphatase
MNKDRIFTTMLMHGLDEALGMETLRKFAGVLDELWNEKVTLRVKRTDDAKKFPMIAIKKGGDVGFDLPAIFPYRPEFADVDAQTEFVDILLKNPDNTIQQAEAEMRESRIVHPGERVVIPTGIFLDIPYGYWASIEARSSTSKKMLIVPKGVIDEGYRGELFAVLLNVGSEPVMIYHGDRYVQLIIHKRENRVVEVVETEELSPSERGATGFGSTGQNEAVCNITCVLDDQDPNNTDVD